MLSSVTAPQQCSAMSKQAPPIGPFPRYIWVHQDTPQDSLDKACYEIWKRVQSSLEEMNFRKRNKPPASEKTKKREAAGTRKRDVVSMKTNKSVEWTSDKYDISCLVAQEYLCLLMESAGSKKWQKLDFLAEVTQKEQVKEKLGAVEYYQKDTHSSTENISTSMELLSHNEICTLDKTSRLSVSSSQNGRQLEKKKDELKDHKGKADSKINASFEIKALNPVANLTSRKNKQRITGYTCPSYTPCFSSTIINNMHISNHFPRGLRFVQYQSSFHTQQRFWVPPFFPVLQPHVGGYNGTFNSYEVAQTLFYATYPPVTGFIQCMQPDYLRQQWNFPKGNPGTRGRPQQGGDLLPHQFPYPHRFNSPFPGAAMMSNAYFTYSRK
ncbi:hypothetical protein XENTR_v10005960 [Xenopus tropicalis]|uniref:Uncharacterized protein C1orf94 homolog isoform X2 n=1 Tax=Xenopus tropicalis TaxID=8364 RepID=A0A8J1J7Y4_XENTR|nr:uncharacterized protein C1orf94 homolog isoform X2 [Xenopus tropicalis]KAE8624493.1 hypothetical protein XENTR_v10005960 [Xenopus tropicalis]